MFLVTNKPLLRGLTLLLSAAPCIMPAYGLDSDKDQNVEFASSGNSTSRVDGNIRIITIEGEVLVTQGTLRITGDRAVLEQSLNSDAINRITITGTPATYQQQLDANGDLVRGDSATILYYTEEEPVIELVGAANLQQHNNVLSCAAVKYFTDSGLTDYTGPCNGVLSRQ